MTFDDDFSKNSWESIKKACELGVAYKMWPGKKEKTLKDTVTGEIFKLIVHINENNEITGTEVQSIKPTINVRTPFPKGGSAGMGFQNL